MSEVKLLAAMMDSRTAYSRVAPFMDKSDFSPPGQFWWGMLKEWYDADRNAGRVDVESLADRAGTRCSGKQLDAVAGFLSDIRAVSGSVSSANAAQTALELKRHNVGMELAAAIASGDTKKQDRLVRLFAELRAATELQGRTKAVSYEWAPPIDEIDQLVGDENRVPLAPSRLNTRIDGGALPGTHILLFARPEMGKSTFCVNFAVRLALKDKRVLYISNEDAVAKLKQRARARGTGMTVRESTGERRVEAIRLYRDAGLDDRLAFLKLTHAGVEALRQPIEEFEPDVLILDQIRNMTGSSEGQVQRLDENGQLFRELLLEYDLIGLSVAQASAGSGKWLSMEDLDSSKTGLPGSADLMLGMGADDDMIARGQRALSICKNKLSSEGNAKEGLMVEMDVGRVSVK